MRARSVPPRRFPERPSLQGQEIEIESEGEVVHYDAEAPPREVLRERPVSLRPRAEVETAKKETGKGVTASGRAPWHRRAGQAANKGTTAKPGAKSPTWPWWRRGRGRGQPTKGRGKGK